MPRTECVSEAWLTRTDVPAVEWGAVAGTKKLPPAVEGI